MRAVRFFFCILHVYAILKSRCASNCYNFKQMEILVNMEVVYDRYYLISFAGHSKGSEIMNSARRYLSRSFSVLSIFVAITLLLASTAFAGSSESYQSGYSFGQKYGSAIQQNLNEIQIMAVKNSVDIAKVKQSALSVEKDYQRILPEKVDWMKGVAEGSGLAYEDILVFNTADKALTGLQGECTTLMAQGTAVAGGKGTIIAKNRDVGANTLTEIGLHERASHVSGELYKAAYIDVPQTTETYKFVGSRTAGRWGYSNGINEFQVSVADNDAPSRDKLDYKQSLHDNDVIRLVLERARTAREGVDIVAGLVEKYGQAWNGIMFEIGDPNELWVVEVTGHRWAAKRYINTVTARSNQYQITDDYDLASKDLISFAVENKWIKPGAEKINFRAVYGSLELYPENNNNFEKRPAIETLYNTEMRYRRAMELLNKQQGNVSPETILPLMRDHYDTYKLPSGKILLMNQLPFYSSDAVDWYNREWMPKWPTKDTIETSMYIRGVCGHDLGWGATCSTGIMLSRPDVPNELGVMYHSYMQPCLSTVVPFYVGMSGVDSRFSAPTAASVFHSISMKAFGNYKLYSKAVRAAFGPYEQNLFSQVPQIEQNVMRLENCNDNQGAAAVLNDFVNGKCDEALKAANDALAGMEKAAAASQAWHR